MLFGVSTAFAPPDTVNVKLCVAPLPTPSVAVMVNGNEPAAVGTPLSVAVPLPLSIKVTPAGSAPDSFRLGFGNPVVEIVNEPAALTVNVTLFALMIAGASRIVSVNG